MHVIGYMCPVVFEVLPGFKVYVVWGWGTDTTYIPCVASHMSHRARYMCVESGYIPARVYKTSAKR